MITRAQIESVRGSQRDLAETEALKAWLAGLRDTRRPLFLDAQEFERVLTWKLGKQLGRQRTRRSGNNDALIRQVTQLALGPLHADKDYELELRINILCVLRGVGVPVASALLALVFPSEFAVIDFRGWRQLFGEERTEFSVSDYKRYMQRLRTFAADLGWPVQEVDHAIWEFDQRPRSASTPGAA